VLRSVAQAPKGQLRKSAVTHARLPPHKHIYCSYIYFAFGYFMVDVWDIILKNVPN
jgi:hypothetical protein